MKEKKSKQVAFDEVFPHPERPSLISDREQFPCSFLFDLEEWKSWETQSMINHKVAVMKAMLTTMIVNETLVAQWREEDHGDIQIQEVVQHVEEMEFSFGDSRSTWTYESPDHIVDESLPGKLLEGVP